MPSDRYHAARGTHLEYISRAVAIQLLEENAQLLQLAAQTHRRQHGSIQQIDAKQPQ